LNRYNYIQEFKQERNNYGGMKQASEKLASEVALHNLAQNAGYINVIRFSWEMESQTMQEFLDNDLEVTIDDTTYRLILDKIAESSIIAFKHNIPLKKIPSTIKKSAEFLKLIESQKTIKKLGQRAKKALEEAMVNGDSFHVHELETLQKNPIISHFINRLFFVLSNDQNNGLIGYFKNKQLVSIDGSFIVIQDTDILRIAHSIDFYNAKEGIWKSYQHYLFQEQIQQPFKQVFREVYYPTKDELDHFPISRRYAGHQLAGSYISIFPVHSQHRGKLFLPFVDDDPKSAEVMAKVILLSKDCDIQDPNILKQINRFI
jgi:hypothetical protein